MCPQWQIREVTPEDHNWVEAFMIERWGETFVIAHSEVISPADHPGFICCEEERKLGLVTYRIKDNFCEVLTLDSLYEGQGIGTALLDAVVERAKTQNCKKVWLITTNDNLQALRFYQKRDFEIISIAPGAVDQSRLLKPSIPLIGENGIPIRDEIELTIFLSEKKTGGERRVKIK
jgi:GNAT superfamily N-acetyltransferase